MPFSDVNDPEVKKALRRKALLKSLTIFLITLIVATSLGMSAYLIWGRSKTAPLIQQTHDTSVNTNKILKRVVSCTTPGKPCYEQGLRNQGAAIKILNEAGRAAAIAAAYCARVPENDTLEKVTDCTIKALKN